MLCYRRDYRQASVLLIKLYILDVAEVDLQRVKDVCK